MKVNVFFMLIHPLSCLSLKKGRDDYPSIQTTTGFKKFIVTDNFLIVLHGLQASKRFLRKKDKRMD